MCFFWASMSVFHVPVKLGVGFEGFSAYLADYFAWLYSAYGFFMQWWCFRQNVPSFDLFAVGCFAFTHKWRFRIKRVYCSLKGMLLVLGSNKS